MSEYLFKDETQTVGIAVALARICNDVIGQIHDHICVNYEFIWYNWYQSRTTCLNALERLNAKLDSLNGLIANVTESDLKRKQGGVWSVIEISEHLYLAEQASLGYVNYKLTSNHELPLITYRTWWNEQKLKWGFKYLKRLPAPVKVAEGQFRMKSWSVLVDAWRSEREILGQFLREASDEVYTMACYKHPLTGRISLFGMMVFFDIHFDRHRRQILMNLKH